MQPGRSARLAIGLIGLALVVTGCGEDGQPPVSAPSTTVSTSTPPTATVDPNAIHPSCVEPAEQAGAIRFKNDEGVQLVGVLLGEGSTGILLGHQLNSSLCGWMPRARELAARGYRVLAFDFGGFGESESAGRTLDSDVRAAAAELAGAGAEKLVLMGASMGGTAVVATAPDLDEPLAAIVSLSGPAVFGRLDAESAAPKITVPVLFVAGELDGSFPDSARRMYAAAASKNKKLDIVGGTSRHGWSLLEDDAILAGVLDFLDTYAPPR